MSLIFRCPLATSLLFEEYRAGVWCLPAAEFTDSSKPDLFDPVVRKSPVGVVITLHGRGLRVRGHAAKVWLRDDSPQAGPGEHADFGLGAMMGWEVGPD